MNLRHVIITLMFQKITWYIKNNDLKMIPVGLNELQIGVLLILVSLPDHIDCSADNSEVEDSEVFPALYR